MPREKFARTITPQGQVLWHDWPGALEYAAARHLLFRTKQQVRHVYYQGRLVWHVRAALPKVAEPCS